MNNSFKSKTAKNLFMLAKTVSSHQKGKFDLCARFKNSIGSTNLGCEFVNGEITNDMIPIHKLTEDCFDGPIVRGDDLKKLLEKINEYNNTPSYYWDRTPDWGYIFFRRSNYGTEIFGVMLSEKGTRMMDENYWESVRKKNGNNFSCPYENETEYTRNFLKNEIEREKRICENNFKTRHKEIIDSVRELSYLLTDEQDKILRLAMFAELLSKVNKMSDTENINVLSFIKKYKR